MMFFQRKSKFALGKNQLVKALLPIALVLAMVTQFVLPVFADQVVEAPAPSFLPGGYAGSISGSTTWTTIYNGYSGFNVGGDLAVHLKIRALMCIGTSSTGK
jgi:hypothetical protein